MDRFAGEVKNIVFFSPRKYSRTHTPGRTRN